MPGYNYHLVDGEWVPLGSGPPVVPPVVDPPQPPAGSDWRTTTKMIPPAGKVIWGVYASSPSNFGQMQTRFGKKVALTSIYGGTGTKHGANSTDATACQDKLNAGIVPRLDWQISRALGAGGGAGFNAATCNGQFGSNKTLFQAIADGNFDADGTCTATGFAYKGVNSRLNAIKALTPGACPTNKIFYTLSHEVDLSNEGGTDMAGNDAGTPQQFAAAWRHVRAREAALSVTNISWFLNFAYYNNHPWGENLTNTGSDGFYPGHNYVDWIGWDPYNSFGNRDNTWRSFGNIQDKWQSLNWWKNHFTVGAGPTGTGTNVYKPVMLGEVGCTERPGNTTDNAMHWMTDMADWLSSSANGNGNIIRAILYFSKYYSIQDNTLDGNGTQGAGNSQYPGTPQKWAGLNNLSAKPCWAHVP